MRTIKDYQDAVGPCPLCGKTPGWFNDIPLKAYCWGTGNDEHPCVYKVVPSPYQPYGDVSKQTRWVKEKA